MKISRNVLSLMWWRTLYATMLNRLWDQLLFMWLLLISSAALHLAGSFVGKIVSHATSWVNSFQCMSYYLITAHWHFCSVVYFKWCSASIFLVLFLNVGYLISNLHWAYEFHICMYYIWNFTKECIVKMHVHVLFTWLNIFYFLLPIFSLIQAVLFWFHAFCCGCSVLCNKLP